MEHDVVKELEADITLALVEGGLVGVGGEGNGKDVSGFELAKHPSAAVRGGHKVTDDVRILHSRDLGLLRAEGDVSAFT